MSPLQNLKSYQAPNPRSDFSESLTFDYSGLEDHIKRQDAVSALAGEKFAALYGGDVAGSVVAGGKVRNLVDQLRRVDPRASERAPNTVSMPFRTVRSVSTSESSSGGGGGVDLYPEGEAEPIADEPPDDQQNGKRPGKKPVNPNN